MTDQAQDDVTIIYTGYENNNVVTYVTPDAQEAGLEFNELWPQLDSSSSENDEAIAALRRRMAQGTFAFVKSGFDYYGDFVAGSMSDFRQWAWLGNVKLRSGDCVVSWVPFSNGDLEREAPDYKRTPQEISDAFGIPVDVVESAQAPHRAERANGQYADPIG